MKKHNEPYKHYHVYLPVRVYEQIAQYAVIHKHSLSQEIARALEAYGDFLQQSDTAEQAIRSILEHMQAKYGDTKEEEE